MRKPIGKHDDAEILDTRNPSFRLNVGFIQYCEALARKGMKPEHIAPLVGVLPETLAAWFKHGKQQCKSFESWLTKRMELPMSASDADVRKAIGEPPVLSLTAELYRRIARAFAENESALQMSIAARADEGDVGAARWLLERRYGWAAAPVVEQAEEEDTHASIDELDAKIARLVAAG